MIVFSAVGLVGLPWLFWLSHSIRIDLDTLAGIVSPDERGRTTRGSGGSPG